jgi:hypothetical protein
MATLDYTKRLQSIQDRRFDRELNESFLTKSFSASDIPDNIKYMVESMRPIDKKYNDRTITAANRVQKHLESGFELHFNRAYKTQGSLITATNIKVHSDFDLLAIIDRYHYNDPQVPNSSDYTESDPNEDIKELRKQSIKILKGIYDEVDDTGEKSISIFNKSLNRKVDIVPAFWFHSKPYVEKKDEYYKGIYLYKFPNGPKIKDFPFAHIHQVNAKGDNTNDGSRRGIRLLKTLNADNEEIDLNSFQLTTIVHSIENNLIYYKNGGELAIAKCISAELSNLIENQSHRESVKSPNGTETPLSKSSIVGNLKKLKEDLDLLIEDSSKELVKSLILEKAITNYG